MLSLNFIYKPALSTYHFLFNLIFRMRFDYEEKSFDSEEGTMTAHPEYFFDWVPEMSNGSENDSLVLPNIPLMVGKYFICSNLIHHL